MKKPMHGITLEDAKQAIARVEAGGKLINPDNLRKAKEVVRYWSWKKSQKKAA